MQHDIVVVYLKNDEEKVKSNPKLRIDAKFLVSLLRIAGFKTTEVVEKENGVFVDMNRRDRKISSSVDLSDESAVVSQKHSREASAHDSKENSNHVKIDSASIMITGMTCANCVNTITNHLKTIPGVKRCDVSLLLHNAVVQFDPYLITKEQIASEIDDIGFEAKLVHEKEASDEETRVDVIEEDRNRISHSQQEEIHQWSRLLKISAAFAIPVFLIAMIFPIFSSLDHILMMPVLNNVTVMGILLWIFSTPVQFYVGKTFYVSAFKSLRSRSTNMAVLVSLGTTTAYIYSFSALIFDILGLSDSMKGGEHFFETASTMITFIVLGKYLEAVAKRRTSQALTKLINLQPETACRVLIDEQKEILLEEHIPLSKLNVHDIVKVIRGEKIPADGVLLKGSTLVQESMITGESMPQKKFEGDEVIGACVNEESPVLIQITRVGADTTLSKIVKLMEQASMSKAPIQSFADSVSSYFVPFVIICSLLTFSIWLVLIYSGEIDSSLLGGQNPIVFSIMFGIAVITVACPCALGLATPTAVMVGTGVAAKFGVLIKGGASLETVQKVNTVVFDKTGTLTHGKPKVVEVKITRKFEVAGFDDSEIMFLAGSAERDSEHPLGRAIVEEAQRRSLQLVNARDFHAVSGRGLTCHVENHVLCIGNRSWMEISKIKVDSAARRIMERMEDQGYTAVCVGVDGQLAAVLAVADTIKNDAKSTVGELLNGGIDVWMISGDNKRTAIAIAKQLELPLENVVAEALPEDKLQKIKEIQSIPGKCIAFVGDGINDSPALAQADLGIAIGAGSDIAIEASGMVLMRSYLSDILTAIDLCRTTVRRIRWNFLWALIFNTLGIPLAAGIFYPSAGLRLSPEFAALAMAFSSLLVLTSSLLLNYYKPHFKKPISREEEPEDAFTSSPESEPLLTRQSLGELSIAAGMTPTWNLSENEAEKCCGCVDCGKFSQNDINQFYSAANSLLENRSPATGTVVLDDNALENLPNLALCSCSCPNCKCARISMSA
jgi:Cu+-exporting ATPase